MTELLNAAYVRNQTTLREGGQKNLDDVLRASPLGARAWELLQTPQTIVSLSRALAREQSTDEDACRGPVEGLMKSLFAKDLIQVSPDA